MRVTIINGSPRKNGATAKILKEIKSRLETNDDMSVSYYDISSKPIQTCIGCMRCYNTGSCHMNDYAEELNAAIKDSEGVIIGLPTYVSNIPGILKNYIDRGHFVVEQALTYPRKAGYAAHSTRFCAPQCRFNPASYAVRVPADTERLSHKSRSPRKPGRSVYAVTPRPETLTPSTHPDLGEKSKHQGLHRYALKRIFRPFFETGAL